MRGWSQTELAEKIHKTRTLISHIESLGKVHPETLKQILHVLETNEEELEYLAKPPTANQNSSTKDLLHRIALLEEENYHLREISKLQKDLILLLQNKKPEDEEAK